MNRKGNWSFAAFKLYFIENIAPKFEKHVTLCVIKQIYARRTRFFEIQNHLLGNQANPSFFPEGNEYII